MIFLDFIEDAPDGLYDLEIALLDGYFERAAVETVTIRLHRAVAYQVSYILVDTRRVHGGFQ
jgi:hypothetical protein